MIIKKIWLEIRGSGPEWERHGWFLFGFLPLYVKDINPRARRNTN